MTDCRSIEAWRAAAAASLARSLERRAVPARRRRVARAVAGTLLVLAAIAFAAILLAR